MAWKITFEVYGENFSPKQTGLYFDEQNEVGFIDISGPFVGEPRTFGSASFTAPTNLTTSLRLAFLADTFEPHLELLRSCGATEWHVTIVRTYYEQCCEEMSRADIKQLLRLQCGFTYDAYSVFTEDDESTSY